MVGKVYLTDLNLSLNETRDIIEFLARKRNIKNYKCKSSNGLFLAIKEINQQEHENKKEIDSVRKELKESDHIFSKSESREIRKNLHNIEKRKQFD